MFQILFFVFVLVQGQLVSDGDRVWLVVWAVVDVGIVWLLIRIWRRNSVEIVDGRATVVVAGRAVIDGSADVEFLVARHPGWATTVMVRRLGDPKQIPCGLLSQGKFKTPGALNDFVLTLQRNGIACHLT